VPLHPEGYRRQHGNRNKIGNGLKRYLERGLLLFAHGEKDDGAASGCASNGEDHSTPHSTGMMHLAKLAQRCEQNAYYEACFKALAQE